VSESYELRVLTDFADEPFTGVKLSIDMTLI